MSRPRGPDSDSLWNDLAEPQQPEPGQSERRKSPERHKSPESGGTGPELTGASAEPPDWALPAWDAVEAGPKPAPASRPSQPPVAPRVEPVLRILNVSEVTRTIRDAVRSDETLRDVWVEGEVGRVTVSSAGHCYFTLKDERSQLACVFFRDDRLGSPFEARTGLRMVAHGRIDVFESQGVYQLYVSALQPAGFGDLALRFEALKARLAAEGLFDTARKRPLPYRPAVIGVATSATGAVWHDICQVISRRWPLARVVIAPCQVQGEGAAQSVVAALDRLARWGEELRSAGRAAEAPAVVILARGGGSLEDLWPFNDERVVRAVVAHPVPVVSGVGHETDVTLADFAADVRAPTPSAAAELVVPDRLEVVAGLTELARRGRARAAGRLAELRQETSAEGRALSGLRPDLALKQARERVGHLLDVATRCIREELTWRRSRDLSLARSLGPAAAGHLGFARVAVGRSEAALSALGPQATLDRGYAIVRRRPDGSVVRASREVGAGQALSIQVAQGEIAAHVDPDHDPDSADAADPADSAAEDAGR